VLGVADLGNDDRLWQLESTLGRVETAGTVSVAIAQHFGALDVPYTGTGSSAVYTPTDTASNCDYDHNGKINYEDSGSTPSEAQCAAVCVGSGSTSPTDFQCSEYSSYASEDDFILIVSDSSSMTQARIQADASAADLFDPVASRGQVLNAFTGVISYFSGGTQFTLNARCDDDVAIVVPAGAACPTGQTCSPLTSNLACVHARTQASINANVP
jgi:hypothetical protein